MAGIAIGNADTTIDNGADVTSSVGATAELATITGNATSLFTAADTSAQAATKAVTAAGLILGGAVAAGGTKILAFDDGTNTAVFRFTSAANDTSILATELTLIGIIMGTAVTVVADYAFIA